MASCGGNPTGVAVEAGQADLDRMRGQREIDVEMRGRGGDAPVAADDPRRILQTGEGEALADLEDGASEPFAQRLIVGRHEAGARRLALLAIRERREERPERVVPKAVDLRQRGAGERQEIPDVELDALLHRRGEVAVKAQGDAHVEEKEDAREI